MMSAPHQAGPRSARLELNRELPHALAWKPRGLRADADTMHVYQDIVTGVCNRTKHKVMLSSWNHLGKGTGHQLTAMASNLFKDVVASKLLCSNRTADLPVWAGQSGPAQIASPQVLPFGEDEQKFVAERTSCDRLDLTNPRCVSGEASGLRSGTSCWAKALVRSNLTTAATR